tara:strand:+ start:210 stop:482 length:273 start_codon:yes stop_codon:yes gene_type:complete
MKLLRTAFTFAVLTSSILASRAEPVECDYMQKIMNKLGREMAVNRQIVVVYSNTARGIEASQALAKQTKDYRLTKKQYQKSFCEDSWSRD